MKKSITLTLLLGCLFLTGCSRPTIENTSARRGIEALAVGTSLEGESAESLLDINIAERYGLNPSDIEEGFVITSSENGKPDKIILVKGKDRTSTENVERSLSNVLINLTSTYKDYPEESKKIETHLFKTRDTLTLLAVCDDAKSLEETFNTFD